ncbi:ArsR/SmtB family transcription factor [Kineococcus indalonis]|uniref:ArsR/SmtB family transcription factor n=1 Tax=Kineococcus indalonis TaxID=2696566 RepID=UPI001411C554|nr:metalloregulator ArsR/SmtB family transcription factor [Kineococcus indalonis]NAZ85440.1 metalloregulator ArsR/SmtB family transcription factor [Kineococcus indalonis]
MSADVFAALGEATRRRVLELLADGEQPAGALVEALRAQAAISQPAVSQHLRVLREAGLVTVRAEGTRRFYALDPAGLEGARRWLEQLAGAGDPLAPFAQPLDALATEVARGRRGRRAAAAEQAAAEQAAALTPRSGTPSRAR